MTVREIRAVTVLPPGGTETGGALHGYALGIMGVAILVMSYGAVVRGARPAAIALIVLALAACAIVLFVDLPVLDDTGLIGRTYDLAEARPATGFYLSSLAALVLVGAVAALVLAAGNPAGAPAHYLLEMPSDADLVRRARGGDRDAFATLIERHHAVLVRSCRRMVGAQGAGDAAQDAVSRRCSRSTGSAAPRRSAPGSSGSASTPAAPHQGGTDPPSPARCAVRGSDPPPVCGPLRKRRGKRNRGSGAFCNRLAAEGSARGRHAVLSRRSLAGRGGSASRHPAGCGEDPAPQGARLAARPTEPLRRERSMQIEMQVADVRRAGERHILMLGGAAAS